MASFVKNDKNFHGARSKTRAENSSSKVQVTATKNSENDEGWGSAPKSSGGASNWDDGWGDIPQDSSASDNAWGQDKLVHGKAERNRRFQSNSNSSFRVPNQSQPNWGDVDEEFPALGSRPAPNANVWEKRKEKFEELKSIEPSNQTEEERMIQKAIELSKMEISREEEKRRQLEEEYKLQTKLLEANPDMFEEFRLGEENYKAAADSYDANDGYAEEFSNDEIYQDAVDNVDGWDSTSAKTIKKKNQKKEKNYDLPEDNFPQLKQDSWSQPADTAARKNSNAGARPKISKVVDMFGGWGTAKPSATASHRDNVENVHDHRSSKWDTVDFASKSSTRKPVTTKPKNQLSSPDPPEVKIENTFSNWDTVEAETATKLSSWDTAETAAKLSNWDTAETDTKLSNWDTNETETVTQFSTLGSKKSVDSNLRNASLTTEKESCKVPNVDSHPEEDTIKVTSKDENWGSESLEAKNSSKTSDNFELNSENYEHGYASGQKNKKLVSQSELKISKSKEDFKTQSRGKSLLSEKDMKETTAHFDKEITSDLGSGQTLEMNRQDFQLYSSEQSQGISSKMFAKQAEIKEKINSLEGKCFDSPSSVENDYSFLLNSIDSNYKGSTAQLKMQNQESKIQTEDLHSRNTSSFSKTEHQFEIPQLANQTASPFSLPEEDASKDLLIPGPHPLYTNYKEAPSLPTFNGFPDQNDNYASPLTTNGGSRIDPPKAAVPTPELINPIFTPQPMMTPIMNPTLIMGMNPMLQQMMLLSNPFFVQQLQQMDMYYKSLGMSLGGGIPMYPQPMPLLNFANNVNPQAFGNLMGTGRPSPAGEEEMIPPPCPTAASPPGINASHLSTKDCSEVDQPDDNFWFSSYLSSDSSLIPPPKPTPVDAPENPPSVTPVSKLSTTAFASLTTDATNTCNENLTSANKNIGHQPYESSNDRFAEVPYATGWGDIKVDSNSNEASGWGDDVDGWESENASTARSMRNPSRHIAEKKTACRQPTSRPNLGHTKT